MGSVYKRGAVLWIAFCDADGKRQCASTKLKVGQEKLAKSLLGKVEARVRKGVIVDDLEAKTATVKDVLAYYMEMRGSHVKSAAKHKQMQAHLNRQMRRIFAVDVRQADVDRYRLKRMKEGVKEKTACNELSMLRTALRYAWKNDRLPSPPRFSVAVPDCARTRVLWPEEARGLLAAAPLDLRRILQAMFTCGLRRGEALALTWTMVNPVTRAATLPAELTKNNRPKEIIFPPGLWDLMHQDPLHSEWVFCRTRAGLNGRSQNTTVEPWTVAALQRAFKALRDKVVIKDLHLHDLRRSMASVAQERGHSQQAVQKVGGWADPAVLQRHYSHASRRAQVAVSADLETLISPESATVFATVKRKPPEMTGGFMVAAQGLEPKINPQQKPLQYALLDHILFHSHTLVLPS